MPPHSISPNVISWVPQEQIEEVALKQIHSLSEMPFIFKHVAVMPDCHFGLGATVGSCIPTLRAIIPAAVGVDIGCGMIAAKTSLSRADLPDDLSNIRKAVEHQIPLSAGRYNASVKKTAKPRIEQLEGRAEELGRLSISTTRRAATGASSLVRSDRATTSSRSCWTKRMVSGPSCTPVLAAWATAWQRITSG